MWHSPPGQSADTGEPQAYKDTCVMTKAALQCTSAVGKRVIFSTNGPESGRYQYGEPCSKVTIYLHVEAKRDFWGTPRMRIF